MKAKISIAVIAILVIVALLCINKPTESVEVTSVAQAVEPTPAPTATPEPTIAPTIEPTATPVVESIEVVEESKGVSEKSIVEVSEPVEEVEEEPAEEVAEAEPTPEVQEETPKAEEPAPSTEPTSAPQAPTTNGGVTPEGQALLEQILADGGTMIEDVPVVDQQPTSMGHTGLVWE